MKASDGSVVQSMDQKDNYVHDFESGKNGMIAKACSQESLMELDSAAERNVKLKMRLRKRKMKTKARLASDGCVVKSMDQRVINVPDFESGKNGMIAKACAQENLMELDFAAKLSQENKKSGKDSTTNRLEKPTKSKKKRMRRAKKKAASKPRPESLDHTNMISNLSLADASDAYAGGKVNNETSESQESRWSKVCSQDNLMELSSAAKMSQENEKSSMVSTTNPLEKPTKSKRKRMRRAKKKAASKLVPESLDHTNMISNLSMAAASDAFAGGNVNNGTSESQESGWSLANGSAISLSTDNICHQFWQERFESGSGICNKKVTHHRSSEVFNKAQNYLLADPYQTPHRRKLLILDVNGLLADIVKPPPRGCQADTRILGRAIFKRPFYLDFLKFCFQRFDVAIWSSRTKHILVKVVDYLLGDLKHKLLFCWDAHHCTTTKFKTLENKKKRIVFKELRKLWEIHNPNLPWEKGDYDMTNALLLDDSPYKALLNPMYTGVFPCSYSYQTEGDNSLGPGGDIRVYLEGLAVAENVQHYVAQHPFGQRAINEADPCWNFYSGVLQSLL